MPSGFGRHQALAHVAGGMPPGTRCVMVVARPNLIDLAFGCLMEAGNGRQVGLLATGCEIEVGTLQRAHGLARDGRLGADLLLVDEMGGQQAAIAEDLLRLCPEALAVRLAEPPEPDGPPDPDSFHFPVRTLETRPAPEADPPPRHFP